MDLPEAKKVFKQIGSSDDDPEKKLVAIQTLLDRGGFSNVTKHDCIEALRWLLEEYL